MPLTLIAALRQLAAVRGYRDPVAIILQAQDKTPRRPRQLAWWLK